jgi:hypothetical protein
MPIRNRFRTLLPKSFIIKEYYIFLYDWFASVHESVTDHPAAVFLKNLGLPKRFFSRINPVVNYFHKLISTLIEATLLVAAVGILCLAIYYTFGMLWYAYLSTPMAENFILLHPEQTDTIFKLSELNLVDFSMHVTLSAFVICFVIGGVCRFLHICHHLYLSQGFFGKLLCWGIPLTAAVSYYIKHQYGFSDWEATVFIVIIPTYLLFISCFKFSQQLIPEVGSVLYVLIPWIRLSYRKIFLKINNLARYLIKQ